MMISMMILTTIDMANYTTLRNAIQQVIKQNGNNEITGSLLQQVLLAMVNSLGAHYQFSGIATESTEPGTPDQNVFYIALNPGVYANFSGIQVFPGTIAILRWNGEWSKDEIRPAYFSNSALQNSIQELYIDSDDSPLYLSIITWDGERLNLRIVDENGVIVAVIINRATKPYEAVYFHSEKDSPIVMSGVIVLNENNVSLSGSGFSIKKSASNLLFKPFSIRKLYGVFREEIIAENAPLCVSRFDRGTMNPNGLYNNSYVSISRHFTDLVDSIFVFGNKDAAAVTNKFFDLIAAYVHERDKSGLVYSPTDVTQFGSSIIAATTTDCILPVVVGAVNNPDGDNTSKWFTGQNHAYGNVSNGPTPTMRELSCNVNVDGMPVTIGAKSIRGKVCTIEVINQIQGFNTCRQDGTGREIVRQKITVSATNEKITVRAEYMALEDVIFYNIPGVGQYGAPNTGRQFRFIGSTSKPGLYDYNGTVVSPSSTDSKINCLQFLRNGKAVNLIYKNFGLGNLVFNTTQNNAYATNANKVYTRLTGNDVTIPLSANDKIGFEFDYEIVNDAL